ncbi:hypothetical protein NG796_17445 [Laspinema sp. A4]|uniref:hypothetical protein n=1 Tax=Laspinema sp. D2d TaxID=2953686 RepID=UPI0021BA7701|nr:hypothetical protein [Laspinema sp. D2d]MCT7985059.1 hypothetical protein [Laspinema sp. D2d]
MSDLPHPNPVLPGIELLEEKISRLPIKKFKWDPTNSLGSYLEMSVDMVNVDEVMKLSKAFILDKTLGGLTVLFKQFWQRFEGEVNQLPTKNFKIDPFHGFNQSATLFVQEVYVELRDIQTTIWKLKPIWKGIEQAISILLSEVILNKERQLLGMMDSFIQPPLPLANLVGKKDDIKTGIAIRDQAIAYFQGSELCRNWSPFLRSLLDVAIAEVDNASWWIENEHRLVRGILLKVSQSVDEFYFHHLEVIQFTD